jgi:cell division protease FtsH
MKRRTSTSANMNPSLLLEIAKLGLRKALRPFLHHSSPSFMAALVLPPGAVPSIYVEAATLLFCPTLGDYEFPEDFSAQSIDNGGGDDVERKFRLATVMRRTLLFLTSECELPTKFALAVDHYAVMPPPAVDHVIVAARRTGFGKLSLEDAQFLATLPPSLLRSAVKPGRPMSSALRRLRSITAKEANRPEAATTKTTPPSSLDDMVGYEEVKAWSATLSKDVTAWRAGDLPWSEVDRGGVFAGPPGTGKTRLAESIAEACGMHFMPTSAARWQSRGHLGDFLGAMRADFKAAVERGPCLMFLEELDSVGDRDADRSDNRQYVRQAVNGVLEALDEALAKEGVVILGATNNIAAIEPALLRSGRIERVFQIGLPTPEQRVSILARYLRPHQVELPDAHFRLVTEGMTGADLERIARDAKRRSRGQGRALSIDDVMSALPEVRRFDLDELRRIAAHEAGHAIVGLKVLQHRLLGIYISDAKVLDRSRQSIGHTAFERSPKMQTVASEYLSEIAMLLGGIAAEDLVFGAHSDGAGGMPGSDLTIATDLATRMESQMGMGATLMSEIADGARDLQAIRTQRPAIAERVDLILREEFKRARDILSENRTALDRLIETLVEHKALRGEVAVEVVETASYVGGRGGRARRRSK